MAAAEGLTEALIAELIEDPASKKFSAREKAALRYADLSKQGVQAIDRDEVYAEFMRFVKSLNIVSWDEACRLNPRLAAGTRNA